MKLGIVLRHAIKLKSENFRIYSSFFKSLDSFETFDYIEIMRFLSHRKDFKIIISSLFVFIKKTHQLSYKTYFGIDSLKFTQAIISPTQYTLKNYQQLNESFGFILNIDKKILHENKKQDIINLYIEINNFFDSLPKNIIQALKV